MTDLQTHNGWVRLDSGYDVEFVHGIPAIISDNGRSDDHDDAELIDMVNDLSGLKTVILGWHPSVGGTEQEASLCIDALQFDDVLTRLARSSAATFVERYHKPIDEGSVDWDKEEYDHDYNMAVRYCCMTRRDFDRNAYFDQYRQAMHEESERLIAAGVHPLVDPE